MSSVTEITAGGGWPELDRLDAEHYVEIPLNRLPAVVRDLVVTVSVNVDVDPTMPALVALGAAAAVCQKTARVLGPKPGWREQLSLFTLCLADVSEHKSPCYDKVMGPLYLIQDQLSEETRAARQLSNTERDVLEAKITDALTQAKRGKPDAPDAAAIAALRHERELLGEHEGEPRLFTDDVTTQAAVKMMAANAGRLSVLSPEMGVLYSLSGAYASSGSADLSPLLSGYSGDYLVSDRVGRESQRIPNPALSLVLVGQPVMLGELANGVRGSEARGLMARFVVARIPSRAGSRRLRGVEAGQAVEDSPAGQLWASVLGRLARRPVSDNPPLLRLSAEAEDRYAAWYDDELEPNRGDVGGRWSWIAPFAGKACGLALRFAGLFHLIEHPDARDGDELDLDTVNAAIEVTEWALASYLAAIVDAGVPDEVRLALRLVKAARRGTLSGSTKDPRPWAPFTIRDARILSGGPKPLTSLDIESGPVELLVARGYLRVCGTPPRTAYEWHPDLRGGAE